MDRPSSMHIDARGLKCPRPIVELAKAKRQGSRGDEVEILADDLAFESDVVAWCETTESELIGLERGDGFLAARIRFGGPK